MKLLRLSKLCIVSLLVGITLASASDKNDPPIVKTQQGSLEGFTSNSRDGKPYYSFLGIRYAEFPGRFEVATSHASWDGVQSAKEYGNMCSQVDILLEERDDYSGEEDCLFLNVFTPTLDANAKLPILFWVHGGGFECGSGNGFDGKYLVDENVIVVSINYRLGPLGFLSFGEDNEPMANIGLKDQLLALKWVQKNIRSFGGDASKVTIAGFSAGAASAHFHVLSEKSAGLFRGAISHSGNALAFWAVQPNPRENAIKLASVLDCPIPTGPESSSADTISCLKSKSAQEVTVAQLKIKEWLIYPIVNFGPVIESKGENSFISEHPAQIMENGKHNKVNWIAGFTEDEGAVLDIPLILNKTITEILEDKWEEKAPVLLGYEHLPQSEQDVISKKIRDHYFGHYEIEELTWTSLRNMLTDRYFIDSLVTSIELQSQHSPGDIFPYVFRFSGDYSIVNALYGLQGDHGIAHGDDLQYLFPGGGGIGSPDYSGETPAQIVEFSRKFVKMWANFIHGNAPTDASDNEKVKWKSYKSDKKSKPIPFYEIAIEAGIWDEDLPSRLKVWQEAFPKKIDSHTEKKEKTEL